MLGTMIGDDRYDDRLSDPSEAGRAATACGEPRCARRARHDRSIRARRHDARDARRPGGDRTPRAWPSSRHGTDRLRAAAHFFGPAQTLAEVASMQAADTPERLDRYEARLRAFPAYMDAWADVAREGIADRRHVATPRDGTRGGAGRATAGAGARGLPCDRAGGCTTTTRSAADRRRRSRRREPVVRSLSTDAARVRPAHHGDDRPVRARRRRRDLRGPDPGVDDAAARSPRGPRTGIGAVRRHPGGARSDRGPAGICERRRRRSRRIRRAARTPRRLATTCSPSRARRSSGAGRPHPRSSVACRATTATSARSRSSGNRTRRSASTTRRPRTDRAAAPTTSTRPTFPVDRSITSRASRTTRPTPDTTSSSRSSRSSRTGPRSDGSGASSRAARSPKDGVSTANAWPRRWACTWTTGNAWACSKPRGCAPPDW